MLRKSGKLKLPTEAVSTSFIKSCHKMFYKQCTVGQNILIISSGSGQSGTRTITGVEGRRHETKKFENLYIISKLVVSHLNLGVTRILSNKSE